MAGDRANRGHVGVRERYWVARRPFAQPPQRHTATTARTLAASMSSSSTTSSGGSDPRGGLNAFAVPRVMSADPYLWRQHATQTEEEGGGGQQLRVPTAAPPPPVWASHVPSGRTTTTTPLTTQHQQQHRVHLPLPRPPSASGSRLVQSPFSASVASSHITNGDTAAASAGVGDGVADVLIISYAVRDHVRLCIEQAHAEASAGRFSSALAMLVGLQAGLDTELHMASNESPSPVAVALHSGSPTPDALAASVPTSPAATHRQRVAQDVTVVGEVIQHITAWWMASLASGAEAAPPVLPPLAAYAAAPFAASSSSSVPVQSSPGSSATGTAHSASSPAMSPSSTASTHDGGVDGKPGEDSSQRKGSQNKDGTRHGISLRMLRNPSARRHVRGSHRVPAAEFANAVVYEANEIFEDQESLKEVKPVARRDAKKSRPGLSPVTEALNEPAANAKSGCEVQEEISKARSPPNQAATTHPSECKEEEGTASTTPATTESTTAVRGSLTVEALRAMVNSAAAPSADDAHGVYFKGCATGPFGDGNDENRNEEEKDEPSVSENDKDGNEEPFTGSVNVFNNTQRSNRTPMQQPIPRTRLLVDSASVRSSIVGEIPEDSDDAALGPPRRVPFGETTHPFCCAVAATTAGPLTNPIVTRAMVNDAASDTRRFLLPVISEPIADSRRSSAAAAPPALPRRHSKGGPLMEESYNTAPSTVLLSPPMSPGRTTSWMAANMPHPEEDEDDQDEDEETHEAADAKASAASLMASRGGRTMDLETVVLAAPAIVRAADEASAAAAPAAAAATTTAAAADAQQTPSATTPHASTASAAVPASTSKGKAVHDKGEEVTSLIMSAGSDMMESVVTVSVLRGPSPVSA